MTSLFQTRRFHIDAAPDHADVLRAIHDRALDLVIIDGVFSPHHCQLVATQLDAQPGRFPFTLQETLNAEQTQFRLIGESLTPYAGHPEGPELSHYFRTAAEFRGHCRSLFGSATDFEATLEAAFASTGGGRAVELPAGPEAGTTYTPATLRELRPSCEIPLHVGDYFFSTPGYEHLGRSVVLHDQLSYFVPLRRRRDQHPGTNGGATQRSPRRRQQRSPSLLRLLRPRRGRCRRLGLVPPGSPRQPACRARQDLARRRARHAPTTSKPDATLRRKNHAPGAPLMPAAPLAQGPRSGGSVDTRLSEAVRDALSWSHVPS